MLLCFLCSSLCFLWLIIVSLNEPVLGFELTINTIERLPPEAFERHIPLITRPTIIAPPVARSPPWPSQVNDLSINTALLTPRADLRGPTLMRFNDRSQRRTKPAKPKTLPRPQRQGPVFFPAPAAIRFGLQREPLQAE